MTRKVLFVDDEENVLSAYTRVLRKRFQLETALGGAEALSVLHQKGPFAVIVSDMRMPEMDGVQLLAEIKRIAPDTTRIMLTGNADQQTAMDAVNQGAIFRFLTKPCDPETLATVLDAAIHQHHLITAEKELLERTLKGAILMLGELLSMLDPASFGRSQQVGELSRRMAEKMAMDGAWMLEVSATLAHIGIHTLPPSVVAKLQTGAFLGGVERQMATRIPEIGAKLIRCIPRLDDVASIVFYAQKNFNGTGFPPDEIKGDVIPLGSRILRVVSDFLTLTEKKEAALVIQEMANRPAWYDPGVIQALKSLLDEDAASSSTLKPDLLTLSELTAGMTVFQDVETLDDWLVIPGGTVLGESHLEKLRNFAMLTGLKEPIAILRAP